MPMYKLREDAKLFFCMVGTDVRKRFRLTEGKVTCVGVEPTGVGTQMSNHGRGWEAVPIPALGHQSIAADHEKTVKGHLPNRPLQQALVSV